MNHRTGFSSASDRKKKANKIRLIIEEFRPIDSTHRVLDIRTGSGEIASILGEVARVTSVDIEDIRTTLDGFQFVKLHDQNLPFPDRTFDVIISNHVIEHLDDQHKHVSEMARVLKDDGLVYLATPNRIWPWEFHYHIALLRYLPHPLFIHALKKLKKYREDIKLLSLTALKKLLGEHFITHICSDRICKNPEKYQLHCPNWLTRLLHGIPLDLYTRMAFVHPALVTVLKKKTW
jgi:SAM-dependent methyltransferase